MKKVVVLTGTRAEYGILRPLLFELQDKVDLSLLVTGTHLSKDFGMTVGEIEKDGFPILERVEILKEKTTASRMAKALKGMSEALDDKEVDLLILLGDRYECLAGALAATTLKIPICHIHGGELTYGAMDEVFRHAITKLSHLHFTSTEEYRRRVIQMGELPKRVFSVGSLGVQNAKNTPPVSDDVLRKSLGYVPTKPILVTYHPESLHENPLEGCYNLCQALEMLEDEIIITGANADELGEQFNECYRALAKKHSNITYIDSLGVESYMTLLGRSLLVVGNSSSGILEVPSFGAATVNIGDRQRGRVQGESIINTSDKKEEILKGITMAKEFKKAGIHFTNLYEGHSPSETMVKEILAFLEENPGVIKEFYDE